MLVSIYSNRDKDRDFSVTQRVIDALTQENVSYIIDDCTFVPSRAHAQFPNVVIVLGGDGTMLSAVRKYAAHGSLLLGINIGRVGFLLENEVQSVQNIIRKLVTGEYTVEERMMLCACAMDNTHKEYAGAYALNEVILSHSKRDKLVNIEIDVDKDRVANLYCDGVIVSTPTGSTGYSMSAGGSIVYPTLDVMQVTPICSHSISAKSTIISGNSAVTLAQKNTEAIVSMSADGVTVCNVSDGGYIVIKKAKFKAKFICFDRHDFFSTLRNKIAEWNLQ